MAEDTKYFGKTALETTRDWINSKLAAKQDTLTAGDNITIEGSTISAKTSSESDMNVMAMHNAHVRGKVLTDEYTLDEIYTMIQNRDYSDIYIGDVINVSVPAISVTGFTAATTPFLVAEIESHRNYGDTTTYDEKGHIMLVPETILGTAYMNSSNTSEGAYDGSYMDNTVMPAVQAALESAFGAAHVLTTREFLTATVDTTHTSKGVPSATGCVTFKNNWVDRKCRLMTELEVYGDDVFSSSGEDSRGGLSHQIALFRADHTAIGNRCNYWLSAVADSWGFCNVDSSGQADCTGASYGGGVRPRFIIG